MAKASKHQQKKRMVRCNFCGGEHRRRSSELRECRKRHRHGAAVAASPRSQNDTATKPKPNYDALGGNPRDHIIIRWAKQNWPARKIAKHLDLPLGEVRQTLRRAGLG